MLFDHHASQSCVPFALLLIVGVSIANAQETVQAFEQLGSKVTIGDHVTVTHLGGREVRGTVTALSSSSLTLLVGSTATTFAAAEVETVSQRDSRWNGTLWGLGVGGVLGAWIDRGLVDEYGREDISVGESVEFIAGAAGLGAGIGFAIDALRKGKRVIYVRPQTSSTKNVAVLPVWESRRRSILVLLRF